MGPKSTYFLGYFQNDIVFSQEHTVTFPSSKDVHTFFYYFLGGFFILFHTCSYYPVKAFNKSYFQLMLKTLNSLSAVKTNYVNINFFLKYFHKYK
jgi:hypothetical protein